MNFNELAGKLCRKQDPKLWRHASGGGWIFHTAYAEHEENIRDDSMIFGNARICGNARISGDARVSGKSWVCGGTWVTPVLFLMDSRGYGVTNSRRGWLRIGCEEHSFYNWKKNFSCIMRGRCLTLIERREYRAIIDLFCKIGK